jgi:hypothetical protein
MQVRLPESAVVKTWDRGEQPVGTLKTGDRVIGYSRRDRDLRVLTVTVEPLAAQPVLILEIQHFRPVNLFGDTVGEQAFGPVRADSQPTYFMGTCFVNPTRMIPRIVMSRNESAPQPGVVLNWEGADLLWTEGLLVGS